MLFKVLVDNKWLSRWEQILADTHISGPEKTPLHSEAAAVLGVGGLAQSWAQALMYLDLTCEWAQVTDIDRHAGHFTAVVAVHERPDVMPPYSPIEDLWGMAKDIQDITHS